MWNASARSARDPTMKPVISSTRKKTISIASMTLILVDLDHAILSAWRAFGGSGSQGQDGNRRCRFVDVFGMMLLRWWRAV